MRPRRLPAALLAACLLASAGCAGPAGPASSAGTSGPAAASPDAPRVLLLGELHDNPRAHQARFELLQARVQAGWRPALVMEQFDRERQPDLDRALSTCADAGCVIRAAAPPDAGWEWSLYEPVIALALKHRLPVLAANVSRADAMRVMRGGFPASLDAATISAYGLDRALPADLLAGQTKEVMEGHCNRLPASMADGMVRAQVARDVWMAKLVDAHAHRGVVLLAGNGHVRKDLGVPRWLVARAADVRSVGFVESDADGTYDVKRVVPPHERGDPCAGLG